MIGIFAALFLCVYSYWLYSRYHSVWKYLAKIPGPTALPLIGNLHQVGITPESYYLAIRRWFKEYDFKIFRVYTGPEPLVLILNPKSFETVLSSTTLTYKYHLYEFMYSWLGKGLLTANGPHWVKHRKLITPSFHFQILQDFLYIMNETTDRFMGLLDSFAKDEKMFDIQKIAARSTIDVICETALGTRVNSIEGETAPLVQAISDLCYCVVEQVFGIVKRFHLTYWLTPDYWLQKKALKISRREISRIIEERRKLLPGCQPEAQYDDFKRPKMAFLDNLLTAEKDGRNLTFQEICDEVSTFIFEGHDTTSSAIAFTTFCLSRHAEVQQKAFDEQFQLFGNDTKRSPSYQELQEMKYLDLVIKETLRLFPSVPFIARTMLEPTEIDGYLIPKGVPVVLPVIAVATDERNFKEPFLFRPERFQGDQRNSTNPYEYVPFSAGPRNCIGQKFAVLELKVTVSKMLRNFEILPAVDGLPSGIHDPADKSDIATNPYDPRLSIVVTLKSSNGVVIRLRKRAY